MTERDAMGGEKRTSLHFAPSGMGCEFARRNLRRHGRYLDQTARSIGLLETAGDCTFLFPTNPATAPIALPPALHICLAKRQFGATLVVSNEGTKPVLLRILDLRNR